MNTSDVGMPDSSFLGQWHRNCKVGGSIYEMSIGGFAGGESTACGNTAIPQNMS